MITAITCTGDRPEALELLNKWIKRQTRNVAQWIVIDDGVESYMPADMNEHDVYIRREPKLNDDKHTITDNFKEAIKHVDVNSQYIFILEDDEYYRKNYIETMYDLMQMHEVVGIGKSRYYHLKDQGYYTHKNDGHASLAQTAFKSTFIEELKSLIDGDCFIDKRIWLYLSGMERLSFNGDIPKTGKLIGDRAYLFDDGKDMLYIGFKGMPGRSGHNLAHDRDIYPYSNDRHLNVLRSWCPDWEEYINIINKYGWGKNVKRS